MWLAAPLAVPRGRWAGGGSHSTMLRGSHNAGLEPPGRAGPARPSSPWGGGQARPPAAVACPPLSCPRDPAAPLPPPPCICTLQVSSNRRTADGRPSPRTARLWERREGGREAGAARKCCRERGRLPVEWQQLWWDCRTKGGPGSVTAAVTAVASLLAAAAAACRACRPIEPAASRRKEIIIKI